MAESTVAPYGAWESPITADRIIAATISLGQIQLDGDDIYWIELRPSEGGRNVIVRRTPDGTISDVIPQPFNARARVHEYGGGDFLVREGIVWFANMADQRVYRLAPGGEPQPITPETADGAMRYADFAYDAPRNRLICVREDHTGGGEAVNTLVALRANGPDDSGGRVLVEGNDFYASPRVGPDGGRLAWLAWHHPNMPWDGTALWVADIQPNGGLAQPSMTAGGETVSIFQPEWSEDGWLYFVSDSTGWWNLYREASGVVWTLQPLEAEFGVPQWLFGMRTYALTDVAELVCIYRQNGASRLAWLNAATQTFSPIDLPYTELSGIVANKRVAVFRGASATTPTEIVQLDLATGSYEVVRRSSSLEIDPAFLSVPESIEFPTEHGQTAHALFYRPRNPNYVAPEGELPPLRVLSHGGPTSESSAAFNAGIQFWTSRGFAVLDVNYGGSSGYGRPYRERLYGQWGVVDVDDSVNGARYLAERGLVDPERMMITGGSAGGYTTLATLTFRDVFKAGSSYFGIGDLEALARDTHKFESRYGDRLVGPYPEQQSVYRERSPINYTDRLSTPVIFFQGMEDRVVPPNQAQSMVAALRAKGLPVAYVAFEGEGHGFRRGENTKRSIEAELYFVGRVFGFTPADTLEPVDIDNLP